MNRVLNISSLLKLIFPAIAFKIDNNMHVDVFYSTKVGNALKKGGGLYTEFFTDFINNNNLETEFH